MMKLFVSNNVVLFIVVVTTTIDASRLFYLPLPKIHSSHQQIQTPNIVQESIKKPISDEFVPSSAIEQEEIEKRGDNFDWETLVDDNVAATKRRDSFDELLPESLKKFDEPSSLDESIGTQLNANGDIETHIEKLSQLNDNHLIGDPWTSGVVVGRAERLQSDSVDKRKRRNDTLFLVVVGTCCAVGVVGLIAAAIFWYKIQKRAEAAVDAEYPSYGVTGPSSSGSKISPSTTMSDRKLAQSAQMFHYQQQRQQMMAQEKAHLDTKPVNSDDSDDETPAGGDYTVYECPGLAPTGEMEVRNPLFTETNTTSTESTSHPTTNNHYPQLSATVSSSSPPKEKSLP
jgi:hypothetical protein